MHHLFFMALFMKKLPLTNLVIRLAMVTVLSSKFGIKYGLGAVTGFVSLCDHVAGFAVAKFRLNELSPYFRTIHSKLIQIDYIIKSYTFSLSLSLSLSIYIYTYIYINTCVYIFHTKVLISHMMHRNKNYT